jgi:hypothetical protein
MLNPTPYTKTSDCVMALLGIESLAYIRPVTMGDLNGYAVFAADGTQLAIFECEYSARMTATQNNLNPVSLH